LKDKYPRIFVNSNLKEALAVDVGEWKGNQWEWAMNWRISWFEWEKPMVEEFMLQVQESRMKRDTKKD